MARRGDNADEIFGGHYSIYGHDVLATNKFRRYDEEYVDTGADLDPEAVQARVENVRERVEQVSKVKKKCSKITDTTDEIKSELDELRDDVTDNLNQITAELSKSGSD